MPFAAMGVRGEIASLATSVFQLTLPSGCAMLAVTEPEFLLS